MNKRTQFLNKDEISVLIPACSVTAVLAQDPKLSHREECGLLENLISRISCVTLGMLRNNLSLSFLFCKMHVLPSSLNK